MRKFYIYIGIALLSIIILVFGTITIVCIGPSITAHDLFVNSVMDK